MTREDVRFRSADADCAGWLYPPLGGARDGACVVRPANLARLTAAGLRDHPGGHFDIYVGEPFERAVTDQIEFLDRVL